jgi:hypothetical protein
MIRVFVDSAANIGAQSFRACIASLLELRLGAVPAIDPSRKADSKQVMIDFLYEHQRRIEERAAAPDGWAIALCSSRRHAEPHFVLCFSGIPVHDPFPLGPSTPRIDTFYRILPADGMDNDPAPAALEKTYP